ncbi:MAG: flagellar biosynthesis protein FlhF [Phycisphaerales bacterium]|nr:flagellar biosynthesis protein FlhF [Phycisphaerales bacterium]
MKTRIYRANSMSEAVAALRQDLGVDAVILETRTARRSGIWGWFGATVVEVHAAAAAEVRAAREQSRPTSSTSVPAPVPGALPLVETVRSRPQPSAESPKLVWTPQDEAAPDREATRRMAQSMLARLESNPSLESSTPTEPKPGPNQVKSARGELDELREMVGQVLKRQELDLPSGMVPKGLPDGMVDWYVELISNEVSEELAANVIHAVCHELGGRIDDRDRVRECVIQQLSEYIPISKTPLPDAPQQGPLVIALVGPTGVGKTTTTAKIAATCRFHRGARVALVTCDTYRVAAVAQLKTYAEILGMPITVVEQPSQMGEALAALQDMDVVIIDTPGRSQRDEGRLDELKQFLSIAQPHQTHLVLSGTAGEKVLIREAEAFLPLGVDRIVLTKLDEAVSFGMLVDVLHRIGRELSFMTTGQEVPADIEPASGDRLAMMVLDGLVRGGTLRSERG